MRAHFVLLGSERIASSRVRGYWIMEVLQDYDVHCTASSTSRPRDIFRLLLRLIRFDVLIFQKRFSKRHLFLAFIAKILGVCVIFDLDDAPSRRLCDKAQRNAALMARLADHVVVGSNALAEWASVFNISTQVIPSSLALSHYEVMPVRDINSQVCIGWIGSGKDYQEDLEIVLRPPLFELAERLSFRLKIVGSQGIQSLRKSFESIPGLNVEFVDEPNWADSAAILREISDFDIGVYPLIPNSYNQFKCAFKALEYMGASIPVVATKHGANEAIVKHNKTGFLVTTHGQWLSALEALIRDKDLRRSMGYAGRQRVEECFSTEITGKQWYTLLQKVYS